MIKINNNNMGTFIREELAVTNNKGEIQFILFPNIAGGITIEQEDQMDAPYFSATFNKEDWEDIKKFIDNQFNQ